MCVYERERALFIACDALLQGIQGPKGQPGLAGLPGYPVSQSLQFMLCVEQSEGDGEGGGAVITRCSNSFSSGWRWISRIAWCSCEWISHTHMLTHTRTVTVNSLLLCVLLFAGYLWQPWPTGTCCKLLCTLSQN